MTNSTQDQLRSLETIGCDLGDKQSELFVIRSDERTLRPKPVATTREGLRRFFRERAKAHVVLEVGTHSRWVAALLEELGHVVTVANPRHVKLISQSRRKTDKADAELLARLGRADVSLLRPVGHRGDQVQADLAVAKARDALVRVRTQLVNQIRGLTKSFGERLPSCDAEMFWKKARESLPDKLKPALLPTLDALEQIGKQIAALDAEILKVARRYPDVDLVTQPKGVGVLTGLVFVLMLEDKTRFEKSRNVGAFLGLCRGRSQSGDSDPELPITKEGDPYLRRLLVQCAHYILGPFGEDSDLRRWGLSICQNGRKNAKKRGRIAVARKLAVLMHRLWVTGEVYQPLGYGRAPAENLPRLG